MTTQLLYADLKQVKAWYQSWTLYLFLLDFPRQNPHPSLTNFAGETGERGGKSHVFCFEVASAVIHQPAACGAEPQGREDYCM